MTKADELRDAFLSEFGEQATQSLTGKLLGFEQTEPQEPPAQADPDEE
jgi:hypothetical protein